MRTAEIFTGKEFLSVSEGTKFTIDENYNWPIGSKVAFQVKRGISVECTVINANMTSTELEVTSIVSEDSLSDMEVEAEDVEVEVSSYDTTYKLLLNKKKFTKKELVSFIEANNLDIDTSLTKANLVSALEALDLIEYK